MPTREKEWIEECKHWWLKVLTGKYSHYCGEWDDLPIDETCSEFMVCTCFAETPEITSIQEKMRKELEEDERNKNPSSSSQI